MPAILERNIIELLRQENDDAAPLKDAAAGGSPAFRLRPNLAAWLNLSHELRTPANAILGHAELMTSGAATSAHTDTDNADEPAALNTSIEDLNLSARTTNALINNDIHTIKDLFSLSDAELRDLKGFGSKALDEVKEKLAEMEL